MFFGMNDMYGYCTSIFLYADMLHILMYGHDSSSYLCKFPKVL